MEKLILSDDGTLTIPERIQAKYSWKAGTELTIEHLEDGIILRAKPIFPATTLDEVAGFLQYDGPPISVEEMDESLAKGIREDWERFTKQNYE